VISLERYRQFSRHPRLLVVFAATLLYSMVFGLFKVAVTAFAAQKGVPAAVAGATLLSGFVVWAGISRITVAGTTGGGRMKAEEGNFAMGRARFH